jgi:hypothetical protein
MDAIDKARKSLVSTEDTVEKSAEVEKTDPDVKAQEEATKSTEEAEKNVNQATISDDNEKVTKDVDDDDVEESADKKDKATKSVDEAEKSEDEPAVEKNTDAKSEEAKAKQHKELTNVDDPKGHEEASKSFDTKAIIDALTKSVDTMAEMQKSYKELAEASMEIAKSFLAKQAPIEDQAEKSVEKSQDKKCGDGADVEESADKKDKTAKSADDDQEPDTDDEAKDDKEDKAKKSVEEPADNADEAEKSVEEPAEEDKAEKSIPTGKAVATGAEEAKDDTVAKSVETQEDGVTKEALENVIAKSLLGFDGVQSGINLERKQALKSLLADTRGLKGTTVPDSFIERYNEI